MTTAIVVAGLLGAVALVLACLTDERTRPAQPQTTAARTEPRATRELSLFAQRAAVHPLPAGRHRR